MEEIVTLVIDNGSGTVKAGIAGEDAPRFLIPSIVGTPKKETASKNKYFVGEEVFANFENCILKYPIEHGVITNWEQMQVLAQHTFSKLNVSAKEHPILFTEPPLTQFKMREKMTELMFDTFDVPSLNFSLQAVLSLYASGRTCGTVLECGDGATHVIPVYEGYAFPGAFKRSELCGRDLTEYLMELLNEKGLDFSTSLEREFVREVKEKLGYVAYEFGHELETSITSESVEKTFELPDGQTITVGSEAFRCAEALFQPSLLGIESVGVHQLVYDCIWECDIDTRRDFLGNVVISGGTTLFPGFADRLQKELSKLVPKSNRVKIVAAPERRYTVWIGGSILASLTVFPAMRISKQEYDEFGPSISHKKCA